MLVFSSAHSNKVPHPQFASTLPKPRLVRQEAVQEEEDTSPPRLGVRFLPTIPSAADSSVILEDGDSGLMSSITGLYANLQNSTASQGKSPIINTSKPTTSNTQLPPAPSSQQQPQQTLNQIGMLEPQQPPDTLPQPQDKPP